jgi:magnesium transporter
VLETSVAFSRCTSTSVEWGEGIFGAEAAGHAAPRPGRNLVHKQHIHELTHKLDSLHPADVAYILEALPLDERLFVWDLVKAERDGEILLEVSDAVRESLIESMDPTSSSPRPSSSTPTNSPTSRPTCPRRSWRTSSAGLDPEEREQLRAAMSYPEDSVGALMDFEMVTVREDVTLEVVLRYLRRFDELPDHTDQLFVVDRDDTCAACCRSTGCSSTTRRPR